MPLRLGFKKSWSSWRSSAHLQARLLAMGLAQPTDERKHMTRHNHRALKIGFTTAALVLVLASTAYACTVFRGVLTVTAVASPNPDPAQGGTVTGWGDNFGMNPCPTKPWEGQARVHAGSDSSPGPAHQSGSLAVSVARSGLGACPSQLAAGTYDVNFLNTGFGDFLGEEPARVLNNDCMTGGHRSTFRIGELAVDTDGNGSGTYVINKPANHPDPKFNDEIPDLPGTESAVCVSAKNASQGMQNPVTVI